MTFHPFSLPASNRIQLGRDLWAHAPCTAAAMLPPLRGHQHLCLAGGFDHPNWDEEVYTSDQYI